MLKFKFKFIPLRKKIKTIDYVFFIIFVFIILFLLSYFSRKRTFVYVDLTYKRQEWNDISLPPEYWEVNSLNIGDIGYNSLGKKVISIENIEKNIWGGGQRMYIEMTVKLDAIYNSATHTYVFDGNPLLIGKNFTVQVDQSEFTGIISNIYKDKKDRYKKYKKADAIITVHYRDYDPWHAEALRNFTVKNSNGDTILKTKELTIKPAEKVVVTDNGTVLLKNDPIKKDMIATFELPNVICDENICYYNHYTTFMIGDQFWADSGVTYIRGGSVMTSEINYHD